MASYDHFYVDSPSVSASNSNDFGLEGNGCRCNYGGWPPPEKQSCSEQDQAEIFPDLEANSPLPSLRGHSSAMLQSESQLWVSNHNCSLPISEADFKSYSEALPQVKRRRVSSVRQSDRNWENCPRYGIVPKLRCRRRRRKVLSDETLDDEVVIGDFCHNLYNMVGAITDEGSWELKSRITQESLTKTLSSDSQVSEIEDWVESKNDEERRPTSKTDLDELLCSIRSLLSIIRKNEESEQKYRDKMKVLEEKKKILKEEKKEYKRRRDSHCNLPV